MQLIPFVPALYAFESPLFYSHHNHVGDVLVIFSTMGTREGDLLGRALFALTHFRALCFTTNHFLSCLFPSIVDDIHIIGPPSIVSFTYEHFQIKLCVIVLSIQPYKCVAWSPSCLPLDFNTHPSLPPHQNELEFWEFHWALHHSHNPSPKMSY